MHPLHILYTLLTFFVPFNFFENFNFMFFFFISLDNNIVHVKRLNTLEIETNNVKNIKILQNWWGMKNVMRI